MSVGARGITASCSPRFPGYFFFFKPPFSLHYPLGRVITLALAKGGREDFVFLRLIFFASCENSIDERPVPDDDSCTGWNVRVAEGSFGEKIPKKRPLQATPLLGFLHLLLLCFFPCKFPYLEIEIHIREGLELDETVFFVSCFLLAISVCLSRSYVSSNRAS